MSNFTKILNDKKRRYINIVTGETISRRQYDKIKGIKPVPEGKMRRYLNIRDSFIEKKRVEGKTVSKRESMNSKELKNVIKNFNKGKKLVKKGNIKEGYKYLKKAYEKITDKNITIDFLDEYTGGFSNEKK